MKDNRIDRRDIDKIRRRLDLLLKDCARYMKQEHLSYALVHCIPCRDLSKITGTLGNRCEETDKHIEKLLALLRGVGIYDTGVRPPTMPKELRQLRGRVSIKPVTKIIDTSLTKSKT